MTNDNYIFIFPNSCFSVRPENINSLVGMASNDLEPFRIFLNVMINYGWYGPVTVCYGLLRIGMKPNVFKTYFHNYVFRMKLETETFPIPNLTRNNFQSVIEIASLHWLRIGWNCISLISANAFYLIFMFLIKSPKLSPFHRYLPKLITDWNSIWILKVPSMYVASNRFSTV